MRVPSVRTAVPGVIVAVTGLAILGFGPPSAATATPPGESVPYAAAARADDAPTAPMPKPQPPAPGKPSAPAVPPAKNPVPAPPPGSDPCESINGIPASTSCSGVSQNQAANDKCQVESFHDCAVPITGAARESWQQDQDAHAQARDEFHGVERQQSAESGRQELCHSSSGMRDRLTDSQVIVPPSEWWAC